jgi:hypothetical protein
MHQRRGLFRQLSLMPIAVGLACFTLALDVRADQVTNDDLIVRGNTCVGGTECVDGEAFAEANLKVKSNDTPLVRLEQTTSGGFLAQNWHIGGNEESFFVDDETNSQAPFSIFAGAPTHSLVVAANGRVGIGTADPESNLHIFGDATQDVFNGIGPHPAFGNGPAFNFGYSGFTYGRGSGFFNTRPDPQGLSLAPNPSLRFLTLDVQRMIIDRNGNVGIGQFGADILTQNPGTSPLAKLHVQGAIRADGGFFSTDTTINPPDYVFEPDYPLLPLKDLQTYIEREKRLPEIPSAQEIKQHGVKLDEMQMQLLKKIEELTLYTLQQEKTNQAQQQMIQEQTRMIEKLQAQAKLMQAQAKMIEELQVRLATLEREQGK